MFVWVGVLVGVGVFTEVLVGVGVEVLVAVGVEVDVGLGSTTSKTLSLSSSQVETRDIFTLAMALDAELTSQKCVVEAPLINGVAEEIASQLLPSTVIEIVASVRFDELAENTIP